MIGVLDIPAVEIWAAFVFLTGLVLAAIASQRGILLTFAIGISGPGVLLLELLLESPGTDASDFYATAIILFSVIFWSEISGGIGLIIGALGGAAIRKRISN